MMTGLPLPSSQALLLSPVTRISIVLAISATNKKDEPINDDFLQALPGMSNTLKGEEQVQDAIAKQKSRYPDLSVYTCQVVLLATLFPLRY
jgi:hypothetical protein